MCDVFLVLAQAPAGLSCFLLPRVLDDDTRNRFFIQRLKDKLGNRSNASGEVEFDRAYAVMVGEEGRGIRTIVEMVNYTRLDCVAGTAALMRQAVAQACHHASSRHVFGRVLIEQPLMQNVLADLALESEAATALMLRLARACDGAAAGDRGETHLKRVGTALGKYWVCKRGPVHSAEALECLGGNGYVEESIMPRLYREAPLNSIWEGSGNVNCLDLIRAITRDPEAAEAYVIEVRQARGRNAHFDTALAQLEGDLAHGNGGGDVAEGQARRLVERLALVLQASLLLESAPPVVGESFCRSRLGSDWGHAFGTLPADIDCPAIIERAWPRLA
jgi:putative acyl-CoA dehydrogenase